MAFTKTKAEISEVYTFGLLCAGSNFNFETVDGDTKEKVLCHVSSLNLKPLFMSFL